MMHTWQALNLASPFGPIRRANVCHNAAVLSQCMLGSLAAQYVETPLFVVNSKFDTWQEKAIIGLNCTVSKCPKPEQDFWAAYGK